MHTQQKEVNELPKVSEASNTTIYVLPDETKYVLNNYVSFFDDPVCFMTIDEFWDTVELEDDSFKNQ